MKCKSCPQCQSRNIEVGAFPLRCLDCGWHYLNAHPCDICGEPAFNMRASGTSENWCAFYGCKEHPATITV